MADNDEYQALGFYFHSERRNTSHKLRLVLSIETLEPTGETPDGLTREVAPPRGIHGGMFLDQLLPETTVKGMQFMRKHGNHEDLGELHW